MGGETKKGGIGRRREEMGNRWLGGNGGGGGVGGKGVELGWMMKKRLGEEKEGKG